LLAIVRKSQIGSQPKEKNFSTRSRPYQDIM
jgi:hypothetical protein